MLSGPLSHPIKQDFLMRPPALQRLSAVHTEGGFSFKKTRNLEMKFISKAKEFTLLRLTSIIQQQLLVNAGVGEMDKDRH